MVTSTAVHAHFFEPLCDPALNEILRY